MSKISSKDWNTKYGRRRVRDEAPTLVEAIAAAQGLSDIIDEQAEIAASLMGLSQDEVRAALLKSPPTPRKFTNVVVFAGQGSAPRVVMVERKPARRVISTAQRAGRPAISGSREI